MFSYAKINPTSIIDPSGLRGLGQGSHCKPPCDYQSGRNAVINACTAPASRDPQIRGCVDTCLNKYSSWKKDKSSVAKCMEEWCKNPHWECEWGSHCRTLRPKPGPEESYTDMCGEAPKGEGIKGIIILCNESFDPKSPCGNRRQRCLTVLHELLHLCGPKDEEHNEKELDKIAECIADCAKICR